jgi:hypothetical protein
MGRKARGGNVWVACCGLDLAPQAVHERLNLLIDLAYPQALAGVSGRIE